MVNDAYNLRAGTEHFTSPSVSGCGLGHNMGGVSTGRDDRSPPREPPFQAAAINLEQPGASGSIRTILEVIDHNARVNPDACFCIQAHEPTPGQPRDATHVTMRKLRAAIWRCTRQLRSELIGIEAEDDSASPGEEASKMVSVRPYPVALFMHSGISLLVYLFSLMALGVPVALVSIRLSPVSIQHLLTVMKAQAVVASPLLISKVEHAFEMTSFVYGMGATKILAAADFQAFLTPQGNDDATPANINIGEPGHYVSELDRNVLILHTSGTTDLPSLVYQSHKMLLGYASCHSRTETEDVQGLNLSLLPLYHGFGLVVACLALGIGKPVLLPPPNRISTAFSAIELVRSFKPKSLTTVPIILEGISKLPRDEGVTPLLGLQYVAYGGGPLDQEVGDYLSRQGIKLLSHFGSTETGPLSPFMVPTSGRSWCYWPLRSDIDIEVEEADSGARRPPSEKQLYKFSVTPFGWDRPFALQDWFAKDESSAVYKAVARQDDLIVLSNGYKVQPVILESAICKIDLVGAAVVFGEGRSEIGVLIEPDRPPEDISGLRRVLWPAIQDACRQMDDHSQLSSLARIVVLGPGQSLPRSDKGSVLRREAYRCFRQEIQKSYSDALDTEAQPVFKLGEDSLENALREVIRSELGNESQLNLDDEFARWGIDSVQAARMRNSLIQRLGGNPDLLPSRKISTDLVYRNTTIKGLARALRTPQQASGCFDDEEPKMDAYVQRFSLPRANHEIVILLTGSTGSLGSWVLSSLVARPEVSRVICIVRSRPGQSEDSFRRQIQAAERSGSTILPDLWSKIALVEADQEASSVGKTLGLSDGDYKTLRGRVTHILHAAWPMNFQLPLESFEGQFASLQGLLQLARHIHSARPSVRPRLLFTSSVAVVGNYGQVHGIDRVPEQRVTDNRCSINLGYSRAKLVCEHILANAADTWPSEMEVSCVRIGQLSGAETNGYWNEKEHFPRMVKLSQMMHAFPRLHVNTAGTVLSEILLSPRPTQLIYHVENPMRQDWKAVMGVIATELGQSSFLVDFDEWLELARRHVSASRESYGDSLMDFFRTHFQHMATGGVVLDTSEAQQISPTLKKTGRVSTGTLEKYARDWKATVSPC